MGHGSPPLSRKTESAMNTGSNLIEPVRNAKGCNSIYSLTAASALQLQNGNSQQQNKGQVRRESKGELMAVGGR